MKQITCPHCGDTYPDFDVAHVCSKGPYAPRLKPKMNERIKLLAEQAGSTHKQNLGVYQFYTDELEKFAQLIVGECCLALWTEECHTSDLAFDEVKRNATRIKEHFGIDPKEITEDMLDRSITWMEQQLADRKKHFRVEE